MDDVSGLDQKVNGLQSLVLDDQNFGRAPLSRHQACHRKFQSRIRPGSEFGKALLHLTENFLRRSGHLAKKIQRSSNFFERPS